MRVHAIITARGGSKGLPRKNVLPLAGKPLIAHTILAARGCGALARCLVTTEDAAIKRVSLRWGAEVIDRPARLAGDRTSSVDVVLHALGELEAQGDLPEAFVLLQPTSPLRGAVHVSACLRALLSSRAACAISVTPSAHPPHKDFLIRSGRLRPLLGRRFLGLPRQALPEVYSPNGAIYAIRTAVFRRERSFFAEPALPYVMDAEHSVDIDRAVDLRLAEALLRAPRGRAGGAK